MEPDDDKTQSFVTLSEGTMVSHYRIADKIGAGGMGEVYLAEDTKLKRHVALKFLPAHSASNADMRSRFTREARAVAALSHPNIVTIYEVGEWGDRPFFAMEHVVGESLRTVIKQGKLSTDEAVRLTMQICEGLHEAHEAGVVHRDIKPGNIIIDTKGRARILDFGLAMVSGEDKLTKTGSTLGTAGYMSPEQVSGKQVDHRSDLFSVGVILYEMLTGRRPFEGDNDAAIVNAITNSTPEPVARFKSGVTGELQQIVDKALSKDPHLRYQHADGMLSDLKRLEVGQGATRKSKKSLWAAVAFVVVLAGYFAVDRFMLSGDESPEGWTNSVAVLVFRDLSPNKDQDYFCEGMTEEIIGRLSTIRQLKVTSTQSMLRFKDTNLDLKEIGKQLKVDNILAGNIQRAGETVRVRAQLIRVADDAHLWSDRYEREVANMSDIFDIQDDISRAIVEVMELTLGAGEESLTAKRGTDDIEAYNAYLQGRYFWRKRTDTHLRKAIEYFEQAINIDPNFALAYSGLSDAWGHLYGYGVSSPAEEQEVLAHSEAAIRKALEFNPNLAEVQASVANMYRRNYTRPGGTDEDFEKAEAGLLRAIEINPGYVWSHLWYYLMLKLAGRMEEAERELMIAYELDPLSPTVLLSLGEHYRLKGDIEEAKRIGLQIVDMEPEYGVAYALLAWIYKDERKFDSAVEMVEKYAEVSPPTFFWPINERARILAASGRYVEADSSYRRAIELAPERPDPYAYYGQFLYGMQRWGEAVPYYEKAISLGSNQGGVHRAYGDLLGTQMGRHAEGLGHLLRAVELNPRDVRAYNSIAYTYDILGNSDSSIWAANKAIEVAPNDASLGNSIDTRADMYSRDGRFDSALSSYRQVFEYHPNDAGTLQEVGNIYTFMKDYERADSIYLVITANPDSVQRAWGRYYRVRTLTHQGKFHEAMDLLQEGIETDRAELGDHAPLMLKVYMQGVICGLYLDEQQRAIELFADAEEVNQGWIASPFWTNALAGARTVSLAKMGRFAEAHTLLDSCRAKIDDSDTRLLINYYGKLARVLRQEGNYDSAVVLAEAEAEGIDVNNQFRILRTLGQSYLEAERFEDAITVFERAMARYDVNRFSYPDRSVTAHYHLGQAYEGNGQTSEAIAQYEIFLDIWKNADEGLESVEDAKARLAKLKGE